MRSQWTILKLSHNLRQESEFINLYHILTWFYIICTWIFSFIKEKNEFIKLIMNLFFLSCSVPSSDKDVPKLSTMDEISTLEPGQTIDKNVHIHFLHHLLPVKLFLRCNDKNFPVKLWPDIGYFVKPLPTNIEDFKDKESRLRGMFEYLRR